MLLECCSSINGQISEWLNHQNSVQWRRNLSILLTSTVSPHSKGDNTAKLRESTHLSYVKHPTKHDGRTHTYPSIILLKTSSSWLKVGLSFRSAAQHSNISLYTSSEQRWKKKWNSTNLASLKTVIWLCIFKTIIKLTSC